MSINATVSGVIDQLFANTLASGLTLSKSATYTSVAQGDYTPLTGAISNTETIYSINVIEHEFTGRDIEEAAGMITETDRKVLMKPISGVDPSDATDDRITIGSRTMQILNVSQTSMGSTNLVWTLQCR